jgi:RNA polymerase-binding protein DksA
MLSRNELAEFEKKIAKRREALEREVHGDAERSRDDVFSSLAGPVADRGDEAQADLLSDTDSAELSRDLDELRELEAAQARLRAGKFGVCEDCGQDIGIERLRAQPAARRCFDCQRVHEKTFAHPGESKL